MKTQTRIALGAISCGLITALTLSARSDASKDWTIVTSPNIGSQDNTLVAIAGNSASDIWAVGQYVPDSGTNHTNTLTLHYDGSAWSVVPSPSAPDTATSFLGVATAGKRAFAVGYGLPNFYGQSLIGAWNGKSWALMDHPQLGMSDMLFSVQALSDHDVWAAGWYRTIDNVFHTLVEHFDGHSWSVMPTPNPGAIGNQLYGLRVFACDDAWAVGQQISGTSPDTTLVLHWDGQQWNNVSTQPLGKAGNELLSVAGLSSDRLFGVGESQNYVQSSQTFALGSGKSKWSILPSDSVGTGENHLVSVAVTKKGEAWAVGHSADVYDKNALTLIEHFDGSAWKAVTSPNATTDGNNFLGGIAVIDGDLWAVGTYDGANAEQTLILRRHL